MDYERSADHGAPKALKIIIGGGFGVGKTTAVGAISEIAPLTTEAEMTALSIVKVTAPPRLPHFTVGRPSTRSGASGSGAPAFRRPSKARGLRRSRCRRR